MMYLLPDSWPIGGRTGAQRGEFIKATSLTRLAVLLGSSILSAVTFAQEGSQAAGNTSLAQTFYARLAEVCPVGADRHKLQEAKRYLAKK